MHIEKAKTGNTFYRLEWNHEDLRYVRGIFPVSDLILSMKQLDKVTAVGHLLSV